MNYYEFSLHLIVDLADKDPQPMKSSLTVSRVKTSLCMSDIHPPTTKPALEKHYEVVSNKFLDFQLFIYNKPTDVTINSDVWCVHVNVIQIV